MAAKEFHLLFVSDITFGEECIFCRTFFSDENLSALSASRTRFADFQINFKLSYLPPFYPNLIINLQFTYRQILEPSPHSLRKVQILLLSVVDDGRG
jgi:hypothetical protein